MFFILCICVDWHLQKSTIQRTSTCKLHYYATISYIVYTTVLLHIIMVTADNNDAWYTCTIVGDLSSYKHTTTSTVE